MQFELIESDQYLEDFCKQSAGADIIAFDTEFVSEYTYRPQLCLIQVAIDGTLAIIDPIKLDDVTPFWHLLTCGEHETVAHAGREEFRFCKQAANRRPVNLFDVQVAAGMVGMEYPASYANLATRLMGVTLPKGETRTDWRRRPLTKRQLEYALHDVMHLEGMRNELVSRLDRLDRLPWLRDEMDAWQGGIEQSEVRENWRRMSGIAGLSARGLAIARELWRWREAEAQRRDCLPRRVLRDDLIVELARRAKSQPDQIRAIRGMDRGDFKRIIPKITGVIGTAQEMPADELPRPNSRKQSSQIGLAAQFLTSALGSICREQHVNSGLVGTVQDVRDLVAYRLGISPAEDCLPSLAKGWRAEIVGHRIDELIKGELAVRITDPLSDQPLSFVPWKP